MNSERRYIFPEYFGPQLEASSREQNAKHNDESSTFM